MSKAEQLVRDYLAAMERRDLAAAKAFLAPGFFMVFPGGARFDSLEELVESAKGRYRSAKKTYERFDAFDGGVYCFGTLHDLCGQPSHLRHRNPKTAISSACLQVIKEPHAISPFMHRHAHGRHLWDLLGDRIQFMIVRGENSPRPHGTSRQILGHGPGNRHPIIRASSSA